MLSKLPIKKLIHKTVEETGYFIGTKLMIKMSDENSRDIKKIIISPGKREKILNELRQVL